MAYYTKVLQPDETVRYVGHLHWIVYKHAIVFAILALCAAIFLLSQPDNERPALLLVVGILLLIALVAFVRAWFHRLGTEIAVTDRRIIFKTGLVGRRTEEMNISKVESVDVNQTIGGRILGYGSVWIKGTGASWEPLSRIASPLQLRTAIIVG